MVPILLAGGDVDRQMALLQAKCIQPDRKTLFKNTAVAEAAMTSPATSPFLRTVTGC
jgi:hypothetical protein